MSFGKVEPDENYFRGPKGKPSVSTAVVSINYLKPTTLASGGQFTLSTAAGEGAFGQCISHKRL
jgi:hypothetical protein